MKRAFLSLEEIGEKDLDEAGGKGVGLARLAALGIAVPRAFVARASFFEEMRSISPEEPEPERLARQVPPDLRTALEASLDALGPAPEGFAVRSSAVQEDSAAASFAGIHESILRVARGDVLPALFRCWASAFAERALLYRRDRSLSTEPSAIRMAVIVQIMLRPSVSGILFTRAAGSADGDLIVEAVAGSGERLAQGSDCPERLRIPRRSGAPAGDRTGSVLLSSGALEEMRRAALTAESAWRLPLDIEWALEGERLHLLQARPVVGDSSAAAAARRSATPLAEDTLWTRANMRELLPDLPSELFLSLLERVDWRECYRRLGTEMPEGTLVRAIEGRPYFNLSLIGKMMAQFGLSHERFARWIGHGEEAAAAAEPQPFRALLLHPAAHLRALLRQRRVPAEALRFFARVRARTRQLSAEDPAAATEARILEAFRELEASSRDFLYFLMAGFNRVTSKLLALEFLLPRRASGERLVNAVVASGENNVSVRQGLDLLRLARLARREGRTLQYLLEGKDEFRAYEQELEGTLFLPAFQEYLCRYGHRGLQETDPAMPLYRDAPGFLLKAIGAAGEDPRSPDPETLARRQEMGAARAWRDLRKSLSLAERLVPVRSLLLRAAVRDLKEAIALRERIRFEGMRVAAELRRFLREAGGRLRSRGLLGDSADLFLLRLEEIEAVLSGRADGSGLPEVIRQRREERSRREAIPMPNLLRESEIGNLAARQPLHPDGRDTFQGLPVGPGRIEGRVVVLEGPHQVDRVRRGDILVAPALDPSWIPLFTLASGLVVEMGGTLSHGSIIAREYGLPAVVNLPGITRALKSGDRILLDGSTGLVRRLGS